MRPVSSCLMLEDGENVATALKRAILEVVASGAATSPEEVEKYASCTMLAASMVDETSSQVRLIFTNDQIRPGSHEFIS